MSEAEAEAAPSGTAAEGESAGSQDLVANVANALRESNTSFFEQNDAKTAVRREANADPRDTHKDAEARRERSDPEHLLEASFISSAVPQ